MTHASDAPAAGENYTYVRFTKDLSQKKKKKKKKYSFSRRRIFALLNVPTWIDEFQVETNKFQSVNEYFAYSYDYNGCKFPNKSGRVSRSPLPSLGTFRGRKEMKSGTKEWYTKESRMRERLGQLSGIHSEVMYRMAVKRISREAPVNPEL